MFIEYIILYNIILNRYNILWYYDRLMYCRVDYLSRPYCRRRIIGSIEYTVWSLERKGTPPDASYQGPYVLMKS